MSASGERDGPRETSIKNLKRRHRKSVIQKSAFAEAGVCLCGQWRKNSSKPDFIASTRVLHGFHSPKPTTVTCHHCLSWLIEARVRRIAEQKASNWRRMSHTLRSSPGNRRHAVIFLKALSDFRDFRLNRDSLDCAEVSFTYSLLNIKLLLSRNVGIKTTHKSEQHDWRNEMSYSASWFRFFFFQHSTEIMVHLFSSLFIIPLCVVFPFPSVFI